MKRLFASFLAVVMLVACFAVSASAVTIGGYPSEAYVRFSEDAVEGGEVTLTYYAAWDVDQTELSGIATIISYDYDASLLEYVGYELSKGDATGSSHILIYNRPDEGQFQIQFADLVTPTLGTLCEYEVNVTFKVLAPAGTVVTLTDDGEGGIMTENEFWLNADMNLPETVSFTVGSAAPATVTAAPAAASIRWTNTETEPMGAKDLRMAFTVPAGATPTAMNFKVTIGGVEKTVACTNVYSADDTATTYTVCVFDIPTDHFDTEISAVLELTFDSGVTTSDALTTTVNAVAN